MAGNMTEGNPGKKLFLFAVPMVLGNIFQQLYNIADSVIVGNYVGADALAAVGASTSITFLFIAVATGVGIGASVIISQLFGAKQFGKMKSAIYTILISILVLSSLLMILGLACSNLILNGMNTPKEIIGDASVYLRIYFMGIVFLFLYNTLTSIFNALGESKIPLFFLMFSSLLNIVLDLVFVIRFSMGVAGVAIATLIAQGLSAIMSLCVLIYRIHKMQITEKSRFFDAQILFRICHVAIPSTIQQSIVSIGMILVQSLVNKSGAVVMAGYAAATKIDSIAIMPMVNVGSAMSTFTAQNIGAQKAERVPKGLKAAWFMILGIGLSITLLLFVYGDVLIGAFVDTESNLDVIKVGVEYLRVVSVFYIVMGTMNIFNGVLRGAGDMKVFMISTLCNLSSRVILAYALSYLVGADAIWWSIPAGWFVGLIIAVMRFLTGKWKEKRLI